MLGHLEDEDAWISSSCGSLIGAGGKHLRGNLVLALCEMFGNGVDAQALDGAASVELLHLGSLVHDDIADCAASRRNVPAVHAQWGTWSGSLVGARLFARSSRIFIERAPGLSLALAATCVELCAGQLVDVGVHATASRTNKEARREELLRTYLKTIEQKTGSLFALSCRLGASLGGADEEQQSIAERWGNLFGLLFQAVDDIADLFGDRKRLGKAPGSDLREGKHTLPWILSDESLEAHRVRLRSDGELGLAQACDALRADGSLEGSVAFLRMLHGALEELGAQFSTPLSPFLREAGRKLWATVDQVAAVTVTREPPAWQRRLVMEAIDPRHAPLGRCTQPVPVEDGDSLSAWFTERAPEFAFLHHHARPYAPWASFVAGAATDTARAFGGEAHALGEAVRSFALAAQLLAAPRDANHSVDCSAMLAGDAQLACALSLAAHLGPDLARGVLRAVEHSVIRTLRVGSPGMTFSTRSARPACAQLQPLAAGAARMAARLCQAPTADTEAAAELWFALTQRLSTAGPGGEHVDAMQQRLSGMALREPSVLSEHVATLRLFPN